MININLTFFKMNKDKLLGKLKGGLMKLRKMHDESESVQKFHKKMDEIVNGSKDDQNKV